MTSEILSEKFLIEEGGRLTSQLVAYIGYEMIKNKTWKIYDLFDLTLNEIGSKILVKPILRRALHMVGIDMVNMEMLNEILTHIGSFVIIFYVKNKNLPMIMDIIDYLIVVGIGDYAIYPIVKKFWLEKMAEKKDTYHNQLDEQIKHPRHRDRYDRIAKRKNTYYKDSQQDINMKREQLYKRLSDRNQRAGRGNMLLAIRK